MANETTSATTAALYANIVQEALFTANERSIMRPLVRNFDLSSTSGKTVQVPVYGTVSAAALDEGVDASNTLIQPTSKTITVGEVGVMATLTDLARNSAVTNVAADIGRILGEAVARKMDVDTLALFAGFSQALGAAGAELTPDLIFQAAAILRANSVYGNLVGVFHPRAVYNLKKVLANTGSASVPALSDVGNMALEMGYVGRIAGIALYESAAITVDGSDDAVGAIFHSDALGMAIKQDLTLEVQRQAAKRADEIVAVATYGVGELIDAYGVKITTDAAF